MCKWICGSRDPESTEARAQEAKQDWQRGQPEFLSTTDSLSSHHKPHARLQGTVKSTTDVLAKFVWVVLYNIQSHWQIPLLCANMNSGTDKKISVGLLMRCCWRIWCQVRMSGPSEVALKNFLAPVDVQLARQRMFSILMTTTVKLLMCCRS